MNGQQVRERLHSGQRVYGTHVCSLTNPVTANMQAGLEYDFVFVCNEHMPIDRTETGMICQFYAAKGISPVVRIPTISAIDAAMALDAGAQGIVVPYLETRAQAVEMVGAVKYRPIKGRKLENYLSGADEPTPKLKTYLERFNRHNYLIIGIESVAAVEALEDLLVPGVDGVFVGPHDLSLSMDIPEEYEHPEFQRVLEDIIARSRRAGVGVGIHLSQMSVLGNYCRHFMELGMNWVLYGADIALLVAGMRGDLREFRRHMGDTYQSTAAIEAAGSCLGTRQG